MRKSFVQGVAFGVAFAVLGSSAMAETIKVPRDRPAPPPFPKVESRFVTPPPPGATRRITVQVYAPSIKEGTTATRAKPVVATVTAPDAEVKLAARRGFWDLVSPNRADTRPGRLSVAMDALARMPDVRRPRLQALQDIAAAHGIPILTSTVGTQVSPALVLALISVESAGRVTAQSHAGAQGLMQLMPATASRFGVNDSFDPRQNIAGGVAYLDWLMKEFNGDPMMVLASYNAGEGAVRKHDGVPPYSETRDYVPKVLAAFEIARGLCSTPPELISDGCVFVTMQQ